MSALNHGRGLLYGGVSALAVGVLLLSAGPALADRKLGDNGVPAPPPSGDAHEQTISAAAAGGVSYETSHNGKGSDAGPLTPRADYSPPPCWYFPEYTPAEFAAEEQHKWGLGSTGYEWDATQKAKYQDGHPYKDFNSDKEGKGFWYGSYSNKSFPPGWNSCDEPYFWVDNGRPPPVPAARTISPEMLAKLAYAEIRVPSTKVSLKPAEATKVNLPTWAWLDKTDFHPVSVTASVDVLGISATTTATPVAVTLEPGTPDATTYPASGACEFGPDGSIGTKYLPGDADKTPPCGITYLRSSGEGTFTLRATVTWKISWTSTPAAGGDHRLPDGNFGSDQPVTVQEIQALNR